MYIGIVVRVTENKRRDQEMFSLSLPANHWEYSANTQSRNYNFYTFDIKTMFLCRKVKDEFHVATQGNRNCLNLQAGEGTVWIETSSFDIEQLINEIFYIKN